MRKVFSQSSEWRLAVEQFITPWRLRSDVVGAVVCGSYVTGNPTRHSDIDIQIILKKGTSWRERGNVRIRGILIEYFANPVDRHVQYAQEDLLHRRRVATHMFISGKLLFDKTGDTKRVIALYRRYARKHFAKKTKREVEKLKYEVWDSLDNLEELYEANTPDFYFAYFSALRQLYDAYAALCGSELPATHKIYRFLTNAVDRRKYMVKPFPDVQFVKLFAHALKLRSARASVRAYRRLTVHVLARMGGFAIDGWRLRTSSRVLK